MALSYFGSDDVDRLFVVHAINASVLAEFSPMLAARRIVWLTIPEVVGDLFAWHRAHPRPAAFRNTLTGDLFHLLTGFCKLDLPSNIAAPTNQEKS